MTEGVVKVIDAAIRERDEARAEISRLQAEVERLQGECGEAMTAEVRLRAALRRYGRHEPACGLYAIGEPECDCGLDAVLAGEETTPPALDEVNNVSESNGLGSSR